MWKLKVERCLQKRGGEVKVTGRGYSKDNYPVAKSGKSVRSGIYHGREKYHCKMKGGGYSSQAKM
jgi:hypothetical protein